MYSQSCNLVHFKYINDQIACADVMANISLYS